MINISKKVAIQALDCGSQAIVITNAEKSGLPIVYVNTAFEMLTGMDAGDVIGADLDTLVASGRLPESPSDGVPADQAPAEQSWNLQSGGTVRLNVRYSPLFDGPGDLSYWLLSVVDVVDAGGAGAEEVLRNALHDARRQLKRLERTDSATGIPNQEAFGEILHRDWAIARREQRRLAVVVFEVDCLDEYRDSLGRHATNSVLRKVAHAISGSLRRAGDFGARISDERFAVVLGAADESQARAFADRITKKVEDLAIPHPKSPVARMITLSRGFASEVPEWTSVCNTLMEAAESRLEEDRTDSSPRAEPDAPAPADLKRLSR